MGFIVVRIRFKKVTVRVYPKIPKVISKLYIYVMDIHFYLLEGEHQKPQTD
jgi:hypothetical protein